MAETKKLNLYQKLLEITKEIGKVEKSGTVAGQYGYKFIEQAVLVAEVRVQLAKYGVMIISETVGRTLNSVQSAQGKAMTQVTVVSRYTLINADDPADRIICDWDAGEALDTSDKATNKATTASHKYFLMKLFNISDRNDPDGETPEAPDAVTSGKKYLANPNAPLTDPQKSLLFVELRKKDIERTMQAHVLRGIAEIDDTDKLTQGHMDALLHTIRISNTADLKGIALDVAASDEEKEL